MKVKAIERQNRSIKIIDQTKLPSELNYLVLDDYQQVVEAIQTLKVRGAPAIGIAAAYGMAMAIGKFEKYDKRFIDEVAEKFCSSRPTAVNLFRAVDRMKNKLFSETPQNTESAIELMWHEASSIHDEDRLMCELIGKNGAELIGVGDTILTHCNTGALATGGIGTALGVIYTCRDQGKKNRIFADETRPVLQGARLTAWELKQEGIPVTLICDNMAGMVMKQGRINHIIVGADRIAKNDDTANKIGTYPLAILAKHHNIPFYVAAPSTSFDNSIKTGAAIDIEERPASEITNGFGKAIAPEDIEVYSPAFDITPNELISFFITEKGIRPGGRN